MEKSLQHYLPNLTLNFHITYKLQNIIPLYEDLNNTVKSTAKLKITIDTNPNEIISLKIICSNSAHQNKIQELYKFSEITLLLDIKTGCQQKTFFFTQDPRTLLAYSLNKYKV